MGSLMAIHSLVVRQNRLPKVSPRRTRRTRRLNPDGDRIFSCPLWWNVILEYVLCVLIERTDFADALTARGETPAAFGRRCIRTDRVAPPSNIPDIAPHRAQDARWGPCSSVVAPLPPGS